MSALSASQERVRELYEAGRCLQAYKLAQGLGALDTWRGTPARLLAGHLAAELGGCRLGSALLLRAARADPASLEARCSAAGVLLGRRGPALTWARMKEWGEPSENAQVEARANWRALQARIAGSFRDFDKAKEALRRAEGLAPGRPSTSITRAWLLEEEDRCDEALEIARKTRRAHPSCRPAVLAAAHLLLVLGRGEEARVALSEAAADVESGLVVGFLAALLADQRRFTESLDCLDRFEALSPLLDREGRRWLAARRSDALYQLGDLEGARRQAMLAKSPFHAAVAERLAVPAEEPRGVLLDVRFVRQHHKTCTPASLASLANFWSRPVDQLALAEAICYDGTPRHRARAWAEANGWIVREFRVTWDGARALLDRGVPFVVAIAGSMFGHDQAVVGYDDRRGTFLLREPSEPFLMEILAGPFLEGQRWSGPRGFVLLPRAERERLADIELLDARGHDSLHEIQMALDAHRLDTAETVLREMEGAFPEHPLTLWAAALVAGYKSDEAAQIQSVEGLLRRFPDNATLLFRKLSLLEGVAPRGEWRRLLEQGCERHPRDIALLSRRAHDLSRDAQGHPRAMRILRTLLRLGNSPSTGHDLLSLARIHHARGRPDEALELSRFAACFEEMNEGFAGIYFTAACARDKAGEALALLRRRFERLAARSGLPAATLSWAYEQRGHTAQALETLKRALVLRPADADLMCLAADTYARHDRLETADSLLSASFGRTRREAWLLSAARTTFARAMQAQEARQPARPQPPQEAVPRPGWLGPLAPMLLFVLLQMLGSASSTLRDIAAGPDLRRLLATSGVGLLLVGAPIAVWLVWRRRRASPPRLGLEAGQRPDGQGRARSLVPSPVGRYSILAELGRGPAVVVYRARDEAWDREVALSIARDRAAADSMRARFLLEAEAARRLRHPNIRAVYDLGEHEGRPYLVSEALEGIPLTQVGGTSVGLNCGLAIVLQVLAGLAHAHALGIVHLDVDPANIAVLADGTVKILGFGCRHENGSPVPEGGMAYRSPEQVRGGPGDSRSDLFSLGLVLHELITGLKARRASVSTALREGHEDSVWARLPQGPQWVRLRTVITRTLQADPADRYPDARSLSADLFRILEVPGRSAGWAPAT
jgi:tetratricopeptide (TPR) repeat protein